MQNVQLVQYWRVAGAIDFEKKIQNFYCFEWGRGKLMEKCREKCWKKCNESRYLSAFFSRKFSEQLPFLWNLEIFAVFFLFCWFCFFRCFYLTKIFFISQKICFIFEITAIFLGSNNETSMCLWLVKFLVK